MDEPAPNRLEPFRQGSLSGRRFVFATMPVGPFSRRLAQAIRKRGGEVRRVLTNGGDRFDWGLADALRPPAGVTWQSWFEGQLVDWQATDVVTMGDFNHYSASALRGARAQGVETHVLEQGYLRPNWITRESNGVNANSGVPRSADFYRSLPPPAEFSPPPNIAPITAPEAIDNILYFSAVMALGPLFPDFAYPHKFTFPQQFVGHAARAFGKLVERRRYERLQSHLINLGSPLFIILLQREGDSQFRAHSDGIGDNPTLIEKVLASFASHAGSRARLVVRNHPLDPAIFDLAKTTRKLSETYGVSDRVVFLDYTALAPLLDRASGVVTLNSTAAITAMEFGIPTKILGRALFDIEGLVDRQSLDDFWQCPQKPDRALFERFRAYLLERTQVFGNFFNREHMRGTAESLVGRMERSEVATPRDEFARRRLAGE